ncbi:pyridoxal-phosphate dependent enzyme [Vibrio maerlii]|uniref:pyridoxal-phosphate dependent enzyme n=1 Tax=Vibrio maerlii TaxID=2231648 RepID=UPI000E3E79AA|nr:pyridoxal-phosphate dependent enzyme [Vibrio maerlii]
MKLDCSPVTQHTFQNIPFYLKRDDLLHPTFSGNKSRKFRQLIEHPPANIDTIIGHGSPQANSLYSMAALAKLHGWRCEFYVNHIASFIKQSPSGNYKAALELGAQVIDVSELTKSLSSWQYIQTVRKPEQNCAVVPEGGRCGIAEFGVKTLANEILEWIAENQLSNIKVALPSGTGTTAFFLQKHLKPHSIEVLTCACVGGEDYLTQQFHHLHDSDTLDKTDYPTILSLSNKHHFAKLYQQDYIIWQKLIEETKVEFDLLYDPLMWRCLLEWHQNQQDVTILYVHQGGLLGNETMLPRYQRKYDY